MKGRIRDVRAIVVVDDNDQQVLGYSIEVRKETWITFLTLPKNILDYRPLGTHLTPREAYKAIVGGDR